MMQFRLTYDRWTNEELSGEATYYEQEIARLNNDIEFYAKMADAKLALVEDLKVSTIRSKRQVAQAEIDLMEIEFTRDHILPRMNRSLVIAQDNYSIIVKEIDRRH